MGKWMLSRERPKEGIKIEWVIKGLNEIRYGTYENGAIATPDEAYRWDAVLYWRYIEEE